MPVQYRQMGKSDLSVPAVGFGCWEMGGTYGAIDDGEVIAAIHRAFDLGVTLFDTALVYGYMVVRGDGDAGRSERLLARALGPRRKDVLVVTKGGLPTRPGLKPGRDGRYQTVIEDCETSLRNLGTDYIDLYLIHWPDRETPFAETMRALTHLVAAGKVRHIGVSNFNAAQLRECRALAPIVTNQVGYNLFDRRWEREMFATAAELGIGIMAYGPLAHGLLTGTFSEATTFDATDWRAAGTIFRQPLFSAEHFPTNLAVVERLKAFAARKGVSLPCLALAWVLANPLVAVALTGARQPAEIEENVTALAVQLTPSDHAELEAIMQGAAGLVDAVPE
jgi:aryl-alcohol dehydrogenase-like predicted oxidoreductase